MLYRDRPNWTASHKGIGALHALTLYARLMHTFEGVPALLHYILEEFSFLPPCRSQFADKEFLAIEAQQPAVRSPLQALDLC